MSIHQDFLSRRTFIKALGYGTALAATTGYSGLLFAKTKAGSQAPVILRKSTELLQLNYNENSLGMSSNAMQAANEAISKYGNRYAMDLYYDFLGTLAQYHDVSKEQLLIGNGSTEILSAVVTYAASQGAVVIEPEPTFGALREYSKNHNMPVIGVPVNEGFEIDLNLMREAASKQSGAVLINLCNPNNPTGSIVKTAMLVDWINHAPDNHIFLIDEAYYDYAAGANHAANGGFAGGANYAGGAYVRGDFAGGAEYAAGADEPNGAEHYDSMLTMIKAGKDNVIVSRTFSKIYGMAGLRMGYGLATEKTASLIKPFAAGFNINVAGIAAASASLADTDYYAKSLATIAESKAILLATLDELSLDYVPSHANFILHRIGRPISEYATNMRYNNIKVGRKMTKSDDWNRLSLGTPAQMREFTKTLKAFRQQGMV